MAPCLTVQPDSQETSVLVARNSNAPASLEKLGVEPTFLQMLCPLWFCTAIIAVILVHSPASSLVYCVLCQEHYGQLRTSEACLTNTQHVALEEGNASRMTTIIAL